MVLLELGIDVSGGWGIGGGALGRRIERGKRRRYHRRGKPARGGSDMTRQGNPVCATQFAYAICVSVMLQNASREQKEKKDTLIVSADDSSDKIKTKGRAGNQSQRGRGRGEREGRRMTHDACDTVDLTRDSRLLRASCDDALENFDRHIVGGDGEGEVRVGRVELDGALCRIQGLAQQLSRGHPRRPRRGRRPGEFPLAACVGRGL